nr:hypothetical protein CFP56_69677 [Quercus suber]
MIIVGYLQLLPLCGIAQTYEKNYRLSRFSPIQKRKKRGSARRVKACSLALKTKRHPAMRHRYPIRVSLQFPVPHSIQKVEIAAMYCGVDNPMSTVEEVANVQRKVMIS